MKDKYPIAEIFTSPQGEGLFAGTLMTFVRLAGCTVGRRYPENRYQKPSIISRSTSLPEAELFPMYTHKCTLYDGRTFACDTDYQVKERLTSGEILDRVPKGVRRVCLTGGEPLMHDVKDLLNDFWRAGISIHIETSGTIHLEGYVQDHLWIAVSPKENALPSMIERANEIKLLIDKDFNFQKLFNLLPAIVKHKLVWLQPVNHENMINEENMQRCIEMQLNQHPNWRISSQQHKLWGVR